MSTIASRLVLFARQQRKNFEGMTPMQRKVLVLNYLANVGITKPANWCAAFVSFVAALACGGIGIDAPKSAGARQWGRKALKLGWKEVSHLPPESGDVWVFWRGSRDSWQGHIGIVIEVRGDEVKTLEGNVQGSRGDRIVGWRKYSAANPGKRIQALRAPDAT
jgi:hypothetical protein